MLIFFFFFKQKTAYEMRISDWSSDVCSSDLAASGVNVPQDAVQTLGDRSVVFVRTRQGFKAQTVRVGTRSGGMVEIASGLPANTVIATTNAFLLKAELGKGSAE